MFPPYAKYFSRIVFLVGYHPYCVYERTATALLLLLLMPMRVLCLPLRYTTMIVFKSFRLCHSSCYSSLQLTFVCFVCGLFFVPVFAATYICMCSCEWISLMCIKFACFLALHRAATQATVLPLFAIYFIESSRYFAQFSFKCTDVNKKRQQ